MKRKSAVLNIVLTAMFIAIGLVLPLATGQLKAIGNMLLPMHIPVMVCGFVLGWKYGLICGAVTPLLRTLIFGMPPFPYSAVPMAFELAAYGLAAGLLFRLFAKFIKSDYVNALVSLIASMLFGRVIWAVVKWVFVFFGKPFGLEAFIAGAFVDAWPGILIQLILIPALVVLLIKAGIVVGYREKRY